MKIQTGPALASSCHHRTFNRLHVITQPLVLLPTPTPTLKDKMYKFVLGEGWGEEIFYLSFPTPMSIALLVQWAFEHRMVLVEH